MSARILYVDDEPFVLNAFGRTARLAGFDVLATTSPDEGLEILARESVEIVCSDYRMPSMTGLEFLAAARTCAPGALRILITAHHDFDVAVGAFEVGIYRLIPKPWKRDLLIGTLTEAAHTVQLRRENERLQRLVAQQVGELEELNNSLDEKVVRRTHQVIGSLVTCLDYRDEETMSHSKRVSLVTREIALRMGVAGTEMTHVEWGAMLHDVGKIGVPDAVLHKPSRLTPEEWDLMRRHVQIGHHMLTQFDFLDRAALLVRDHHERFDGSGYPRGLAGEDIYAGARMFAVADTFDAITSDRPYRKARGEDEARAELRRVTGTQLDPACVRTFLEVPGVRWREIREIARVWAAERTAVGDASPMLGCQTDVRAAG